MTAPQPITIERGESVRSAVERLAAVWARDCWHLGHVSAMNAARRYAVLFGVRQRVRRGRGIWVIEDAR